MTNYNLKDVSDAVLLRDLDTLAVRDRVTTAAVLAHIAEVDARRLYAPAGYSSMHAYCVEKLCFSDDAAYKRILAARTARRFPQLFALVAEGRLHLTAVRHLAPHLTTRNADELLAAAIDLRKSELETLLARRFPRAQDFATLRPFVAPAPDSAAGHSGDGVAPTATFTEGALDLRPPEVAGAQVPGPVPSATAAAALSDREPPTLPGTPAPLMPLAPARAGRFVLQVTLDEATREKLRHAQALLAHALPSGDVAAVLDRALDALIGQLEQRKVARTDRPRTQPRTQPRVDVAATVRGRFVSAEVRRTVWERDGGRCTFVGDGGHRCGSRRFLEFDHVTPVARGGQASVDGMRLRCRTHNRLEAERAFGAEFMERKRDVVRHERNGSRDLFAGLRKLGLSVREAARVIQALKSPPPPVGPSLEERLGGALQGLRPAEASGAS